MTIVDDELVTRLRRLDAGSDAPAPHFDYQGLLARHAARRQRARRRRAWARGLAGGLAIVLVGVSASRFDRVPDPAVAGLASEPTPRDVAPPLEPRIVRADTWLALAALEDHIASIDDALSDARVRALAGDAPGADVARLERTRAELLDSYVHVRYADRVAATF